MSSITVVCVMGKYFPHMTGIFWDRVLGQKHPSENTERDRLYVEIQAHCFVLGSTLPGRLRSGHKYSHRRFELWVRHVCALSCFLKAPCLQ